MQDKLLKVIRTQNSKIVQSSERFYIIRVPNYGLSKHSGHIFTTSKHDNMLCKILH